ncbi:unnamed protein product [Fusarium graminearum]|nr:unnamed protein product [Fusarium graminearum]
MIHNNTATVAMLGDTLIYVLDDMTENGPSYLSRDYNLQHYKEHMDHLEIASKLALLRECLCARPPVPLLPENILHSIELILMRVSDHKLLTPISSLSPSRTINHDASRHSNIHLWKGDITTLTGITAITNAANNQGLGCFQPTHRCIDNIIHTEAGPRLREECFWLMKKRSKDLEPGDVLVTGAHALHASSVIHTVGPQPKRGGSPTNLERAQLAKCYEGILDAVELLPLGQDGRKSVALCCISTGLFAFPADEAAKIAVSTVTKWLKGHPSTTITDVVFNTFTESDTKIYTTLLDSSSTSISPLIKSPAEGSLQVAQDWLRSADAILVTAGAGLSAAEGLDYHSRDLFKKHFPGFLKFGLTSLYSCLNNCRNDAVVPSTPLVAEALPFIDPVSQKLTDSSKIPICRFCGSKMSICVRAGSWFNQTPYKNGEAQWKAWKSRITKEKKKLVILELGVGMNTPGVLRWPNEDLVERSQGLVKLIRVGIGAEAMVPWEQEDGGLSTFIQGDIQRVVPLLLDDQKMGLDALTKLASAGEAVYQNLSKKWEHKKRKQAEKEWLAKHAEEIRQRNEFLSLVSTKITGDSSLEMAPLICNPYEMHRAVFLITTPISFGVLEVSQSSYKLLARHVGMSLNSVSHWAVCVIDRGLGECYCYDLMSDRLELTMLGKNYFRVAAITPEFVNTWSSCYYIGETTKTHDEIQEIGNRHIGRNPRYSLLSNNCQHLVDSLVKELCNGKVISQAKLDEELSLASPKIARDLLVGRIRSKMDGGGESEDSPSIKEHLEAIKSTWGERKLLK